MRVPCPTVDKDGVVRERFQYDAFGKGSGLTSDWDRTFTGQVLDSETGLMLYRNRFYHPELGRFVTRDAIGYLSNDINIYKFLGNEPISQIDSLGLERKTTVIDVPIAHLMWMGDHAGGSVETVYTTYRITIVYTEECVDDSPMVALHSITGNHLFVLDTCGIPIKKVLEIGIGIDLEYDEIPIRNPTCPNGGGWEKRKYIIKAFRWQGVKIGDWDFRLKQVFYEGTFMIEANCCCD